MILFSAGVVGAAVAVARRHPRPVGPPPAGTADLTRLLLREAMALTRSATRRIWRG